MPNTHQLSYLLVDDDTFMLTTITRQLNQLGIEKIQSTNSAHDALRLLANRNTPIHVVITDLNMPGMDGIQLLHHLGSLGFKVGVILISGEDPRLLESVTQLGEQYQLDIIGSLNKPVQTDILAELLKNYQPCEKKTSRGPGAMVFADELHQAIVNNELQVHYQPQICIQDHRLIGVEALARWTHSEKGPISPLTFIGIAEKHNMIGELTDSIFKQATSQLGKWRQQGLDITLSVNFSAHTLTRLELPELLAETLNNTGVPPEKLVVELTESALSQDANVSLNIMTRLRLKGFGLSIDDFGTGFSSLDQLKKIPFTELKIDQSFVHQSSENKASLAILESSIQLAKKLDILSVAEGVEDQRDWDLIKKLGCDVAQGYLIAKPMPAEEIIPWAKTYRLNHHT